MSVVIANQGDSTASDFDAHFWRNGNDQISCFSSGWTNISPQYNLTSGEQVTWNRNFTAPRTPGVYIFAVMVDWHCAVDESNESNNLFTITYTVVDPSAPTASPSISPTPNNSVDWEFYT